MIEETGMKTIVVRHPDGRAVRLRVLKASGFAVLVGILVLMLDDLGVLRGPLGIVLLTIVWVALPSAKTLSRRLALNGAIGLGVIPVLWWVKWPVFGLIGHVGVVLALLFGIVAYRLVASAESRRALFPRLSIVDWIPLAAAVFAFWFFWPFLKFRSGVSSIALLMNGFGNDNVGHFDMFSMIRRTFVTGPGWGAAPGGSAFAYVPYPQHFHVLVAFAAELWQGTPIGSVDAETGLFGLGTAVVLSVAFITLVAAIVSLKVLKRSFGISLVAAAGALSVLLLGLGSTALISGFPGFLLAVFGTLIACIIGLDRGPTTVPRLLAVSSAVVLTAHSWSLLTPIAAVALGFVVHRLPRPRYASYRRSALGPGFILLFAAAGVTYAAVLVYLATKGSGSPESALAAGTPFAPVSLTFPLALALSIVAVSLGWLTQGMTGRIPEQRGRVPRRPWNSAGLIGLVVVVGMFEAAALVIIQLRAAPTLSYFQFKFIYAMTMVFAVLLIVLVGARMAAIGRAGRPEQRNSVLSVVAAVLLACGLISYSGLTSVPTTALVGLKASGLMFRDGLVAAALSADSTTARLVQASTLMKGWPCDRPVYLALVTGDLAAEQANQWAMSFSATWTERAAPINSYLFEFHSKTPEVSASAVVTHILNSDNQSCIIVAPEAMHKISATVTGKFVGRILTWS